MTSPFVGAWVAWLVVINVVTAAVYAWDKQAARRGARRVPERRLWLLCALGGVVGAWLVFFGMHHKTRHRSFWLVQAGATVAHGAFLWWLVTR